jgi:hypothetical protein
MHRRVALTAASAALFLAAQGSWAQVIDCSAGCTETKYGLGHPDDFDYRVPLIPDPSDPAAPPIVDAFAFSHADFKGTYLYSRTPLTSPSGLPCGPERTFQPIPGQVILRERTVCTPTSEGPEDVANGGTAGGCPVEIPQDLGSGYENRSSRAVGFASELIGTNGSADLYSASTTSFSRTAADAVGQTCHASNFHAPTTGLRYRLPASRGGDGTKTYIRWTQNTTNGLFGYTGEASQLCCQGTPDTFCGSFGWPEWPLLNTTTCAQAGRIYHLAITGDWIFDGDAGTFFQSDPGFIVPGAHHGVCRNNRLIGCDTAGVNPCPTLPVPDVCDLTERGIRGSRPANLGSGLPNPDSCGSTLTVLRGTPNRYCAIIQEYPQAGDPGPLCEVWTFGANPRPDMDCDGVVDAPDLCPFISEYDPFINTDTAAGDGAALRGDECECGDQTGDGRVSVQDLIAINTAIFNPSSKRPLCDAQGDYLCTVNDIVGANQEVFTPGVSLCRHVRPLPAGG